MKGHGTFAQNFNSGIGVIIFWPNYIFFCFGRIIQKKYRGRINKIQKFLAECDFISLFDSAFGQIQHKKM
jgi:hypothetical protein